jgi:probable phosphoglycerate mutase
MENHFINTVPNWLVITAISIVLITAVSIFIVIIKTYFDNGYVNIWGLEISNENSLTKKKSGKISENQFTWSEIENGVKKLKQQIIDSDYRPTLLVGIGRGGAIICSLLSGNLCNERHIPFIALERKYENKNGMRCASLFDDVSFSKDLDRVLLVAGDIVTGKTADVFIDFIKKQGAKDIRILTYIMVASTNKKPDFFYSKINSSDFKFPWMFSNEYVRDSRIK